MKHQGRQRKICFSFHKVFAYNYNNVPDVESDMLGSKEKLSKAFLQEPTVLVLSSFEIMFVKRYVLIYVKNLIM